MVKVHQENMLYRGYLVAVCKELMQETIFQRISDKEGTFRS